MKIHTGLSSGRLLAGVFIALIAAGCAPKPRPDFCMLNVAAPTVQPGFEQGIRVGLGPIELQAYRDRG